MTNVFAGVMPALMTPCKPDRTPDFRALTRKGRELIEAGMSAVVYCGSMGDWPLLTDEQRMQGVEHLVDAGVPVIVGTGAQNSPRAAALAPERVEELEATSLGPFMSAGPAASSVAISLARPRPMAKPSAS